MKILVACEESQVVCAAFRERGHEAYSCDIQEPSGSHPEWHIMEDVLPILDGNCRFFTMNGEEHRLFGKWDMIIAHPPCTYLSVAGNHCYSLRLNPAEKVDARIKCRDEAALFFMRFVDADCERICIENPVGYMNTHYRKPDQIIHPYYFAKDENDKINYQLKRTCLWLKNLPLLICDKNKTPPGPLYVTKESGKKVYWTEGIKCCKGEKTRAKARSKTFPSIANAMAEQWG